MSDIEKLQKEIRDMELAQTLREQLMEEKKALLGEIELLSMLTGKDVTIDDVMALRGEDYIDFGDPEDRPKRKHDHKNKQKQGASETKPSNEPLSFEEFSKQMEQVIGEFGGKVVKQTEEKTNSVKEKLFGLADNPKVKQISEKVAPIVDNVVDFGQRKFDDVKDFVEEKIDFSAIQDKIEGGRKFFETKKFLEQFENVHPVNIMPNSFTVWFDEFGQDVFFTFKDEHTLVQIIFFEIDVDRTVINEGRENEGTVAEHKNLVIDLPNGREIETFADAFELDAIVCDYYMG